MIYSFHPDAEAELADASEYYDGQEAGLGASFTREVFSTIDLVVEFPNSWPQFTHRTRRCLCNRFPYAVVYQYSETELTIYAIAHQSRKPGYWKDRLM